jgi:hypothetical protein
MITQLIILSIITFLWPLFPPVLVPLSYSFTGALLLQHANPFTLSIISVWSATLSTIIIRIVQNHIIKKLNKINIKKNSILNEINKYFKKNTKIKKLSLKREQYIQTKHGKIVTFFFAIICYLPIIPDIITTRLLYKKIKFPYFLLALIIGKFFTHVPFIFLWKWLLELISTHF